MTIKKIRAGARSKDSAAGLKRQIHGSRPGRQGKPLGPRSKPKKQPSGPFHFSDRQWGPIGDRSGFDDNARKRVEQYVGIYRNQRETELLALPPAETRAELARLQSLAAGLWKQIERCVDDARAWDLITDRHGWDGTRLYAFQDDVRKFANLIGRAKDRVERARPGATAHHNLNMLILSLVLMWEEIRAAKFTRTKKRSGPNGMYNGTEFIIRVCKTAEPDFSEGTFGNAIRYVLEHKAEWQN
jgi:hypothetical protein